MTDVDSSSHSPAFIQGLCACNGNAAETRSLFGVPHCVCTFYCSSPWGATKHPHPAETPWKRAVVLAGPTCISSFPGSSLVPPLKINKWRGCLWNRWKSLTVRFQKPLQSSSVPPVDKILSHSKQKAAQGLKTYVLWQILLKQLKALLPIHTLHCSSAGGSW